MHRKITALFGFLLIFCTLSPTVDGLVQHQVRLKDGQDYLNTTLVLQSPEPTNYWRMEWSLPSGSQLIELRDSIGAIEDYSLQGNNLTFTTNQGERRQQETVTISARFDATRPYHSPLARFNLSLPSLRDEQTYLELSGPDILSWSTPLGFESSLTNERKNGSDISTLKMAGEGLLSLAGYYLTANSSDRPEVVASDHFLSVQGYNFSQAEDYYPWLAGIAGFYPDFSTLPVVVLPRDQYRSRANSWSMGTYEEGGIILLREAVLQHRSNISILLHEAMHGFNAKALRWDRTDVAWFDEGVAKFVEFLVNSQRVVPQAQIFGDNYTFDRDGRSYYLKPRGEPQDLWNYYQQNKNFMRYWTPKEGNQEFGYAFAELFLRNYVKERGFDRLRQVYRQFLSRKSKVDDREQRAQIILNALGSELNPCQRDSRAELELCLSKLRNQSYQVPLTDVGEDKEEVNVPQINSQLRESSQEESKREEQDIPRDKQRPELRDRNKSEKLLESFLQTLQTYYTKLVNWLMRIL